MSFRSLPRPSSSLNAKASTVCPYLLDLRASRTAIRAPDFVAPRNPSSATRLAFRSFVAHIVEFAPHFVPQAYALSSPSVILDVLNPKMFVKTCVFRHSFSCHFFFCVVFKEHFASVFSAAKNKMVGLGRLELLTSRLSGVRSNQLSYRPI